MGAKNLESMRKLKATLTSERRNREWPETICSVCGEQFRYHCSWSPVPTTCRRCRAEGKNASLEEKKASAPSMQSK